MDIVLIVGTAKGAAVYRPNDARDAWSTAGLIAKGWIVTAATRDSLGRYYLAVTSDVYGTAILFSDDLTSWAQLEQAPRYEPGDQGNPEHQRIVRAADPFGRFEGPARHVDQIWTLHAVRDELYAGVSEAGLFRSDDRGKSWAPVRGLNDHPSRPGWVPGFGGLCAHTILSDQLNPRRMWVGISSAGVFRTDDGGATWARTNGGVPEGEASCVHGMAHDPQNASVIYRQDHRGMFRTDNGGDTWELIENGLPLAELSEGRRCVFGFPVELDAATNSAFIVPLEGDNFRLPHDGRLRVYRTTDGGASWESTSQGLPEQSYTSVLRGAMAVDGLDPLGVYFGTTAGTLFASRDAGQSWSRLPGTLPRILSVEAFAV